MAVRSARKSHGHLFGDAGAAMHHRVKKHRTRRIRGGDLAMPEMGVSDSSSGPRIIKQKSILDPRYDIAGTNPIQIGSQSMVKTFVVPGNFTAPNIWPDQDVDWDIATGESDVDISEIRIQGVVQASCSSTSMVAFPTGAPVALSTGLAASICDRVQLVLGGTTVEEPKTDQIYADWMADLLTQSNDWVQGQKGLQDAFLTEDPGETQDTLGQPGMASFVGNKSRMIIIDNNSKATLLPVVVTFGGAPTLGVKLDPNSAIQTIPANNDTISIQFIQGNSGQVYNVFAAEGGLSALSGATAALPIAAFTLATSSTSNQPAIKISGSTFTTTYPIVWYAQTCTAAGVVSGVSQVQQSIIQLKLYDSVALPYTPAAAYAAAGGTSEGLSVVPDSTNGGVTAPVAGDSWILQGPEDILTTASPSSFWKRQALTDAGRPMVFSFCLARKVKFLRYWKKIFFNNLGFFIRMFNTNKSIASMFQVANGYGAFTAAASGATVPGALGKQVAYPYIGDIRLQLVLVKGNEQERMALRPPPNTRVNFTWPMITNTNLPTWTATQASYNETFSLASGFTDYVIIGFNKAINAGDQSFNNFSSVVPQNGYNFDVPSNNATPGAPAYGTSPTLNPVQNAYISWGQGIQYPYSAFGTFKSDLEKIFNETADKSGRVDPRQISSLLNLSNFTENYFFLVFNLKNRPGAEAAKLTEKNVVSIQIDLNGTGFAYNVTPKLIQTFQVPAAFDITEKAMNYSLRAENSF